MNNCTKSKNKNVVFVLGVRNNEYLMVSTQQPVANKILISKVKRQYIRCTEILLCVLYTKMH